jgi:DNA-binding GntR family transcriptional regulator
VVRQANRGYAVAALTRAEISQIPRVRDRLEGVAIREAARQAARQARQVVREAARQVARQEFRLFAEQHLSWRRSEG